MEVRWYCTWYSLLSTPAIFFAYLSSLSRLCTLFELFPREREREIEDQNYIYIFSQNMKKWFLSWFSICKEIDGFSLWLWQELQYFATYNFILEALTSSKNISSIQNIFKQRLLVENWEMQFDVFGMIGFCVKMKMISILL